MPVVLVDLYGAPHGLGEGTAAMVGLAAFLGHLWPVFFRFQGGKGVATAAGVLLALNPLLGLATLGTWVIIAAFFRYSSLAAIVAAVFAPFYQLLIWGGGPMATGGGPDGPAAGVAPQRQHREAAQGHRKQARPEGRRGGPESPPVASARQRTPFPSLEVKTQVMSNIQRFHVGARMSEAAVYNGTVYLAGQVADDGSQDISGQTRQVLAAIDRLLAEAGSDKSRILRAQIFIADLAEFAAMNAVWEAWVVPGHTPPRATVQAALAKPEWKIEIVVTAAVA